MVSFRSTLLCLLLSASAGFFTTKTSTEDSSKTNDASWRDELPETLRGYHPDVLQHLRVESGDNGSGGDHPWTIYVLGVNHIHPDSAEDVGFLLEAVRPDVVFAEMYQTEYECMLCNMDANISHIPKSMREYENMIKNMNLTGSAKRDARNQLYLAYLDQTEPGGEMMACIRYWEGLQDEPLVDHHPVLVLGDRPGAVTNARPWTRKERLKGAFWKVGKFFQAIPLAVESALLTYLVSEGLVDEYRCKERRAGRHRRLVQEQRLDFRRGEAYGEALKLYRPDPAFQRIVAEERDVYMACKLYQAMRWLEPKLSARPKADRSVVVVVGAAHVVGVCDHFRKLLVDRNPAALLAPLLVTTPVEVDLPRSIDELVHGIDYLWSEPLRVRNSRS